ncbi:MULTISPECIES: LegC family aminotransferase [unclassified Mesotoga]|uniref:LegC family aminotransferase n=1 Tax=unclassified Mesotoga TaxID=1184398 RepID=UPI000DB4DAFD|nr:MULTISPECIES: LegC family aminotransferase [unclassified Mesotoga]PZC51487.1 aminotransferase DegT [Mesotoga sp. TolDC]
MDTIFLDAPNLGELEKQYLLKCVDSTFVSTAGPFIPEFEDKFARYVGTKRAVSTQSGTAAIHLALHELGVGPGDEVIVPVITFIASVNPIVYVGATPVFVDIDPSSWNMIPEQVEKAITKKTKAILPVHIYGNPCDMDALTKISESYGIPIIEDATESLGASVHGQMTGTFGSMACFSFNGNKVITTGGGGMITTNDEKLADHMKFLVNQARDESKGYYHPEIGFNYRMTNLEASLGLAQFERLPDFLQKKKRYCEIYREILTCVKEIEFQEEYHDSVSSWWLSSIKINHPTKGIPQIQKELKEKGIPTRRVFVPITEFPPYAKYKRKEYPNSYELYEKGLNLPSSTLNSEEQAEFVARSIVDVIKA